jgi:hypothetical protein
LVQPLEERRAALADDLVIKHGLDLLFVQQVQCLVKRAPVVHGAIVNELFKPLQV